MAFTYDLDTNVGQIRLRIADTVNTDDVPALMSDEELTSIFSTTSDLTLAAAMACRSIAAHFSRLARRTNRGGVSDDTTKAADHYLKLAETFEAQANADTPLETQISPSWERFSYAHNIAVGRSDETAEQ